MIFPRGNGVLLAAETGEIEAWQYAQAHPEVTLKVLFGRNSGTRDTTSQNSSGSPPPAPTCQSRSIRWCR
jgi:hypothetical protein